jgi:uncharacterized repeat protein (TIGR03833 family)
MDESDGSFLENIKIGYEVEVVQKPHQRSGQLTTGAVKRILTKNKKHTHGIKVMLDDGVVGRVKKVLLYV